LVVRRPRSWPVALSAAVAAGGFVSGPAGCVCALASRPSDTVADDHASHDAVLVDRCFAGADVGAAVGGVAGTAVGGVVGAAVGGVVGAARGGVARAAVGGFDGVAVGIAVSRFAVTATDGFAGADLGGLARAAVAGAAVAGAAVAGAAVGGGIGLAAGAAVGGGIGLAAGAAVGGGIGLADLAAVDGLAAVGHLAVVGAVAGCLAGDADDGRRGHIASYGGRSTQRTVPSASTVQAAWMRASFVACLAAKPYARARANSSRIRRRLSRAACHAAI
jgi:hypothetical protein